MPERNGSCGNIIMRLGYIEFHPELCDGCGRCVEACPKHLIRCEQDGEGQQKARLRDRAHCVICGSCAMTCPRQAIWVE